MTDHDSTQQTMDNETPAAPGLFGTMALQLLAAARHPAEPEPKRYNPRPPGVIQAGSATQAVLAFLEGRPTSFFSREQLMWHCKRSGKALDWALLFLRSQGLVEVVRDTQRNPRYLRYRLAQPSKEQAHEG